MTIDPKPTCGVADSGPIYQGQNVTLTCRMTYYHSTGHFLGSPTAQISASIAWQSDAGTFLGNSSTVLANNDGGTLQVDSWMLASGTEIPSYSCTATSYFTGVTPVLSRTVAVNSVTWTCVSDPLKTSRTYKVWFHVLLLHAILA